VFEVLIDGFFSEVLGLEFAVLCFLVFQIGDHFLALPAQAFIDLLEGLVGLGQFLLLLGQLVAGGFVGFEGQF
jgi:hypothetical protein